MLAMCSDIDINSCHDVSGVNGVIDDDLAYIAPEFAYVDRSRIGCAEHNTTDSNMVHYDVTGYDMDSHSLTSSAR